MSKILLKFIYFFISHEKAIFHSNEAIKACTLELKFLSKNNSYYQTSKEYLDLVYSFL